MSEYQESASWLPRGACCRRPPWLPAGCWEHSQPPRANPVRGCLGQSCQPGRDRLPPVPLNVDKPVRPPCPRPPVSENPASCCLSCCRASGRELQRFGFFEKLFHSFPASAGRLLRRSPAAPVGLQANREMITVTLEGVELSEPINDPGSHRRPIVIVVACLYSIFALSVANPVLGQKVVAIRKGFFPAGSGVSRIPVQHEMGRLDRLQNPGSLRPGGGIEAGIIFQKQGDALLTRCVGRSQEFLVDRPAIRLLVIQAPEIEAAHAIGLEGLGQL